METWAHKELKKKSACWLKDLGYSPEVEFKVGSVRCDVAGFGANGVNEVIAIECGNTQRKKLEKLSDTGIFNLVMVWTYKSDHPVRWASINPIERYLDGMKRLAQEIRNDSL